MNKVNIAFGGITNVPDDSFSKDGDMSVLQNMRHKGGELVECKRPSESLTNEDVVRQALYHSNSGYWLELTDDDILYYRRKEGDDNEGELAADVKSFALMGNIVIMYLENSVEYAIWRNGGYVYLGPLPEVPRMSVADLDEKTISRQTEYQYYKQYSIENADLYNRVVQKGFVDEVLNAVYKECGYVDRAWFRVGLKLFDGSYIALSGIYQLSARRTGRGNAIGVQNLWGPLPGRDDPCAYTAKVNYFVPKISVNKISSNWKDIIASIDVFSTGSIMSYIADKERGQRGEKLMTREYEWYRLRTAEELKDALTNATFHKVAEFDIDGNELWKVDNTSPSVIAVQDVLNDIQMDSVIPKSTSVINSRLHAFDTKTLKFKGFAPAYKNDSYNYERFENEWTVVVFLDTDDGEKTVVYNEDPMTQNPDLLYYFMYPDSRAKRMEIYKKDEESDGYKCLKISLVSHRLKNEAYFLQTELTTISTDEGADGTGDDNYYKNIPVIKSDYAWEDVDGIPNSFDGVIEQSNVLKVSAVDNPFYFPAAQTYKFEGDIVGIASNAEAISTGQFGAYPLFVFTKEGIWAMQVDTSGQGAYTTQSPFSREVCSGAICPVSGGIVFTTQRGVMAISGGQVIELSKPLDGNDLDLWSSNEGLWAAIWAKVGQEDYKVPVSIREYLDGAKLAYNYLHNEIILSKAKDGWGYSFVYSLDNQKWSMIDTVFDVTTNSYPELVVYNNIEKKRYTFDDKDLELVPVVAITRPFTLGTLDYKRLRQAALRCTFEGSLNFYVLGSNDGASFVCITGKECPTKSEVDSGITSVFTRRDLITAMSRSKQYKYFAIAIAGQIEGRISLAELLVDAGFAVNKLR